MRLPTRLAPFYNAVPPWALPRSKFYLDFAANRYHGGQVMLAASIASKLKSCLIQGNDGGNGGGGIDEKGIVTLFPTTVPRIVPGYGLLIDPATTNYCLRSRDLANAAWTKSSMTTARTSVGADLAANGATRCTATAANATASQAITLTSRQLVTHAMVRRITGTGPIRLSMDNESTYTEVSGLLTTNGYVRCPIPAQTLANPTLFLKIDTSGDAVDVDFFQCENNAYPTGPLPTTTATVSRGVEEPCINDVGGSNPNDGQRLIRDIFKTAGPFSGFFSYSGTPTVSNGFLLASDVPFNLTSGANGTAVSMTSNGVSVATANSANAGQGNYNKVAFRVDAEGVALCLNGGAVAKTSSITAMISRTDGGTHFGIGNNGAGNSSGPLGGNVKAMGFADIPYFDGDLQEFTRADSRWGN